jgi:hypothetical protein
MANEAQINANRQNAARSTGPRTEAGRNRSRLNAVKHGFRAEKAILPDEDPAVLQERLDAWTADLQPRNSVEQHLVDRGVRLSWQLDRVTRAQDGRTSTQMIEGGSEEADLQAEEILEIGKRLFWDNRGPINFYPHRPIREVSSHGDDVPRTSFCESPDDPDQPALLVRRLQSSAAGCQWMLDRWDELGGLVECELAWLPPDKLKAIRLLGMQPIDAVDDLDVARIFLACFVIRGSTGEPFLEIMHELYTREEVVFRSQLAARQLTMFLPKDAAEAREMLAEIVASAKDRLTARLGVLLERDNKIKALAADRLAFDDTAPGELLRRYEMTSGRALNRTLELLLKLRVNGENAGFATAVAADVSATIATAQTNNSMITTSVLQPNAEPAPAPNEANDERAIAASEANSECANAPNEPNLAGAERDQDGRAEFEARNQKVAHIEKPESGSTAGEPTKRKAEGEPDEAQFGYWEHTLLERALTTALRN